MLDQLYLQKGIHFDCREYIDANEDDELNKEKMVFMITGLKNTLSLIIKAYPEVTVDGE